MYCSSGLTPVYVSLEYGSFKCFKLLVKSGADVNKTDNEHGMTPVLLTCRDGISENLQILTDNEANSKYNTYH